MTQQAGAAVLGFLFWIHMEHTGNTKPSCCYKSDSKVAHKAIINKAAEWKEPAEAGEPSGVSFRLPLRSNAD